MIEWIVNKPQINMTLDNELLITTTAPRNLLSQLQDLDSNKKYKITIVEDKPKRSLDANAYAWVLISKIAEKMNITKEEAYRNAIREISTNYVTGCYQTKDVNSIKTMWEAQGLGWQVETFPSKVQGCTNVNMYYGSSVFNSAQISIFIDGLIQDAQGLGIETKTPDEIENMKSLWSAYE